MIVVAAWPLLLLVVPVHPAGFALEDLVVHLGEHWAAAAHAFGLAAELVLGIHLRQLPVVASAPASHVPATFYACFVVREASPLSRRNLRGRKPSSPYRILR